MSRTFSIVVNRLTPALLVALTALLLIAPMRGLAASEDYAPVLASVRTDVEHRTEGKVSTYDFNLTLNAAASTISGTERVAFVNMTDEPQTTVYFRTYPNADYYDEGGLTIERARVNGEIVNPTMSKQDTVFAIPLPSPLAEGDHVSIALRFTVTVPADSTGTYGVFSRDTARGMWVLADWYPILAGWDPDQGWRLDPPTPFGDPTFSDIGIYDLSIALPKGWTPAATGAETPGSPDGDLVDWNIQTGPVREFTMVLDDDFQTVSQKVDGTTITVYTDGNSKGAAGGELALAEAVDVLHVYSKSFGRYPYSELDLVETKMDGALGISWTGLVFLSAEQLLANPFYTQTSPDRLRFTVAHEVGHQWWGAIVGIDSNDYTYLLEGLTNYLAIVAVEQTEGAAAARNELQAQCVQPYLSALDQYGDGIANLQGTEPVKGPPRGTIIYGKAALGFMAIREAIGDKAFFAGLREWADANAYGLGSPTELEAAWEDASGKDLATLWSTWFDQAVTTPNDVQALLAD